MTAEQWAEIQRINRRRLSRELIAARNRAMRELRAALPRLPAEVLTADARRVADV